MLFYTILKNDNMLFSKKSKKIAKYFWMVVGALLILGLSLFFAPGLIPGV